MNVANLPDTQIGRSWVAFQILGNVFLVLRIIMGSEVNYIGLDSDGQNCKFIGMTVCQSRYMGEEVEREKLNCHA